MLLNFIKALEGQKANMPYNQFWRYTKGGQLPKVISWIAERPDLAEALAADARELQNQRITSIPQQEAA
jgi:hypothetical protein